MMRRVLLAAAVLAALSGAASAETELLLARGLPAVIPVETPSLGPAVRDGTLDPVARRLPAEPLVVDLAARDRTVGVPGGRIRTLFAQARDIRLMVVYGYARLVGYDADYTLRPDILRAVEIEDGRSFTLHLRKGHRWSDGHPFTTEDFRYWWEDVANDRDLSPSGPPEFMLVDGAPPEVTILGPETIRFAWPAPNPRFLPTLAQARPPFIYRPAHYLRQFHARYTDPATLDAEIAAARARNWAQLHNRRDAMFDFDNPDQPTLQPWMNTTPRNGQRYMLVRNPYYHRVDPAGQQLPYADEVEVVIAAGGLFTAKLAQGEADLQARGLSFRDAAVLRRGEATGGYVTHLWTSGLAAEIALYPNLNTADPGFRALMRDRRFRKALSLGIDRRAINQSLYFGLAEERTVGPLEPSPFFDPELVEAPYDPAQAGALLDALGLTGRAGDGTRLLPDGRRHEIVVESAGERREEADAMQIVGESLAEIGVRLIFRPLDRDILRNAAYRGVAMMPMWMGWTNGIPTADDPPTELAPVDQANFSWPAWGQHVQTHGKAGEPPDTPQGQRLLALFGAWTQAGTSRARAEIWREMLAIHAEEAFVIGLVSRAPQPVAVSRRLRNVPEQALFAWDPGAHFGIHRIDEFFFAP